MNNEPAFPCGTDVTQGQFAPTSGMTLRDYFAAKAMQPLISGRNWAHFTGTDEELIAQWAKSSYVLADAMMKARGES